MAALGHTGALNHLLDPPAAVPFSTSGLGPEHRHQNFVPEVAAVVLPASCAQWKECVTLNKISLTKALGYCHSPAQRPNSREEIKAWLLAHSACPRYEMQPQQFERPFQKKWLMSVGKWEEPKLTSRSFLSPCRCDWWQRKVHLHHSRGDGCCGSVYQTERTSLHRRAGPSKQFPDQPPAWQPNCCSNCGMKLRREKNTTGV